MNDETIIDNLANNNSVHKNELDGVRTARILAFFIDYMIIGLLCIPFALLLLVATVLTIGHTGGLATFLFGGVALTYLGLTMGSEAQATIGMQMMGLKIKRLDQKPIDFILACVHGILFWAISTIAVFIPLLVSLFSSKKRLLHDILLGTYVARI